VTGVDCCFLSHITANTLLTIGKLTVKVKTVVSDSEIILTAPIEFNEISRQDAAEYIVTPVVDQSEMFNGVSETLNRGNAIGIFPEGLSNALIIKGGSHDRSEFLPLKPGFAMMVLGAMKKYPGLDVKIVPVGLNYFHRDKFRSRVVVEFGDALSIDEALVSAYAKGDKRAAVEQVVNDTLAALQCLTLNSGDWETLSMLQATRRLYVPSNHRMDLDESVSLTRKLVLVFD
jgi:glycerol-3-phosphate O-acyltransferase/dihydroxyacetone phosphate acyltransferase